jgi:hypothetical protein
MTDPVALSVVVVAFGMPRELPRTLRSLVEPYQHGAGREREIIVVDNGSPEPVLDGLPADLRATVRVHRIEAAPASPAHAANVGLELARGELIGLVIDGARLASPGLLGAARRADRAYPRSVVTAPAWHLGPALHSQAEATGYDQGAEDRLLAEARWEDDGYALFGVSTPAASSARGLFGPMGESSSLFLRRAIWDELGGLDERFDLPGGGLVNHDLYFRACALPDVQLVVLLGEGTFHQVHGGAATSGRIPRDVMRAQYEALRGAAHCPPSNRPAFLGSIPPAFLPHLRQSVELAEAAAASEEPRP